MASNSEKILTLKNQKDNMKVFDSVHRLRERLAMCGLL